MTGFIVYGWTSPLSVALSLIHEHISQRWPKVKVSVKPLNKVLLQHLNDDWGPCGPSDVTAWHVPGVIIFIQTEAVQQHKLGLHSISQTINLQTCKFTDRKSNVHYICTISKLSQPRYTHFIINNLINLVSYFKFSNKITWKHWNI